jgi:hypothetical protein
VLSFICEENEMSEMETKDDVKTEAFTDELSDEALDREEGRFGYCSQLNCRAAS